jgi:hypothetical protein
LRWGVNLPHSNIRRIKFALTPPERPVYAGILRARSPAATLVASGFDPLRVFGFPIRDTFCDELSCQLIEENDAMFGIETFELLLVAAIVLIAVAVVAGSLKRRK